MWGAELINQQTLSQDSLASGDGSLYAVSSGDLVRISPSTGNIVDSVRYSAPVPNPPQVIGGTVWVVSSYGGGSVVLSGYDARTLARVATVSVPSVGPVSATAQGILSSEPGDATGDLYLAAGDSVAVVNPSSARVIRRIATPEPANSVAIGPGGGKLYVSEGSADLVVYNAVTGARLGSSAGGASAGAPENLVATSGGVWGTAGVGMSEWVWFAPGGNLASSSRVTEGAGAGLDSLPSYSGGTVWIGGSHTLACASPATGKVRASAVIPTDGGVVEYFSSVTVSGGRAYSYYENQRAQQFGVARLTPPAACG
jgi:hypothetical protein